MHEHPGTLYNSNTKEEKPFAGFTFGLFCAHWYNLVQEVTRLWNVEKIKARSLEYTPKRSSLRIMSLKHAKGREGKGRGGKGKRKRELEGVSLNEQVPDFKSRAPLEIALPNRVSAPFAACEGIKSAYIESSAYFHDTHTAGCSWVTADAMQVQVPRLSKSV